MSVTDREAIGPASTVESQPFWEGLRAHRLMLQRCADCKKPRHYPRPMCDRCFSLRDEWFHASGHGQVHSWTVCHHAFHPGFADRVPYVLVTAQMAHGVRMVAPLDENDGSVSVTGRTRHTRLRGCNRRPHASTISAHRHDGHNPRTRSQRAWLTSLPLSSKRGSADRCHRFGSRSLAATS